jgi:hypothetical protein
VPLGVAYRLVEDLDGTSMIAALPQRPAEVDHDGQALWLVRWAQ